MQKKWPLLWIPCLEKYLFKGRKKSPHTAKPGSFRRFGQRTWQKLSRENMAAQGTVRGGSWLSSLSPWLLEVWHWETRGVEKSVSFQPIMLQNMLSHAGSFLWTRVAWIGSLELVKAIPRPALVSTINSRCGSRKRLAHRTVIRERGSCSEKQISDQAIWTQ